MSDPLQEASHLLVLLVSSQLLLDIGQHVLHVDGTLLVYDVHLLCSMFAYLQDSRTRKCSSPQQAEIEYFKAALG